MSSNNPWKWSVEYQKYYRVEMRRGIREYIWDESQSSQQAAAGPTSHHSVQAQPSQNEPVPGAWQNPPEIMPSGDSAYFASTSSTTALNDAHTVAGASSEDKTRVDSVLEADPNMALPAPEDVRAQIAIKGTPGWYETLDSDYRVRTKAEQYDFFTRGRIFAMLWAEPAGEIPSKRTNTENTRVTMHPKSGFVMGRFGERIYCSIRRFVIVRVNRNNHFVEACAISTYGNQGVLKPGCNPLVHTIVHSRGTSPQYLDGEYERGMTKSPIVVETTNPNEFISPWSRIRLGKTYSIECNVKVRDIGKVPREYLTKLLRYHQEEQKNGFEPDDLDDDPPQEVPVATQATLPVSYNAQGYQPGNTFQTPSGHQNTHGFQQLQDYRHVQGNQPQLGFQSQHGYQNEPTYQDPQGHYGTQAWPPNPGYPRPPNFYGGSGHSGYP